MSRAVRLGIITAEEEVKWEEAMEYIKLTLVEDLLWLLSMEIEDRMKGQAKQL